MLRLVVLRPSLKKVLQYLECNAALNHIFT